MAPWELPVSILFYLMVLEPLQDPFLNKLCWMLFNMVIFKCYYFFFIQLSFFYKEERSFFFFLFFILVLGERAVCLQLSPYNRCLIGKVKYK